MKNKMINVISTLIILSNILSGCFQPSTQKVGMVKQLNDKKVGIITGTNDDALVLGLAKNANIVYFSSLSDSVKALKDGKIDAVVYDEPPLKGIVANQTEFTILNEYISNESYALAVKKGNKELLAAINKQIETIKKENAYEDMINRWMPETGKPGQMPRIELTEENGILTFGTATVREPFSYLIENQYAGLDIELAMRIAKSMGKDLKIVNMEYEKLVPALLAGEVDFIGAGLTINQDLENEIAYSKVTFESGNAVLVKKQ